MRITGIESTDLFLGTTQRPFQAIRVTLANEHPAVTEATVRVQGNGVREPQPFVVNGLDPGEERTVEVPVEFTAPYQPGGTRRVTVTAAGGQAEADITIAEPGWTMWMVSHFHYDPVWWNTQGQFTEAKLVMPDEDGGLPDVRTALELVQIHLAKARSDPDYKFVLAEIDYLKPYLDTFPRDRAYLKDLIKQRRLEIVGGNYNEPNTNLTCAESTIRNAVYGIGYQRDVAGGDPRSAWMLDVFGHDPGYPGLMAGAGLTSSAWARGPFHQWGPAGAEGGGVGRMQFPSEFEWLSPDGNGLLTHYMAHHYGGGWVLHSPPDLEAAERAAYEQFRDLARVATTRNVLLPVGSDHVIPARWVTDIHRSWNQRYVWPRFVTAVPGEFFDAVRGEAAATGAWITPQTRDMNPVYTGKDVSCIDTKQAHRAIETAVCDAERLATLAMLRGAPYPHASLDKVWRILAFCAHHDGITGVESDQVYLDLTGSWREAWDRAGAVRREALSRLSADGVAVWNTVPRARDGIARVALDVPDDGTEWLELRDSAGDPVPALAEGVRRRENGSLAEVTLAFAARDVPGLGYRSYAARAARPATAAGWARAEGLTIENAAYLVTADPARGGTVRIADKRTGFDVLREPGNELVLQEEYAQHPRHGEGPWHLSPKGPGLGSGSAPATVRAERCPIGSRLVAEFRLGDLSVLQETLLWDGAGRVEFRTHVDGSIGKDHLLRVRFPADVPGGLPVYQTATAAIGRSFGAVDVDSAGVWYTLDNPALGWFGLGATVRVRSGDQPVRAIGVAEVISPDDTNGCRDLLRDLLIALAGAGVTATCSHADGPRYGAIDADSNLPDVRIVLGGPDLNAFSSAVLAAAGPGYAKALTAQLETAGTARVWVPGTRSRADAFAPNADLRGVRDLPVLIVAGSGPEGLAAAVSALIADLDDAVVDIPRADGAQAAAEADLMLADRSVALLNRGTPGCVVTPDGVLHMSLMRSCSAWPSGIWIDGERRTAPDGSAFSLQHWSHTFEYALASGAGDWRKAGFNAHAEEYAHDLIAAAPAGAFAGGAFAGGTPDAAPPGRDLLSAEPASITLSALKPLGNPLASGHPAWAGAGSEGPHDVPVTVRLRETEGRATTARIRLAGGITSARLTDLLEETAGAPLPVIDGAASVEVPAFGTVTMELRVPGFVVQPETVIADADALTDAVTASHAGTVEPVRPVYSRYWLHGKGPAPAGNLPVAVRVSPTRVALGGEADSAEIRVTVACGAAAASGAVDLVVPAGLEAGGAQAPLRYELAAGGYAEWVVNLRCRPGTRDGRYFVAARIVDESALLIEDTVMVAVGEKQWPDRDLPPEEAMERMLADYSASAAEVELELITSEVRLAPGRSGELVARVTSHLASPLRGEAQLISPFGSWELLGRAAQAVSLLPGESQELRYPVRAPTTARPGSRWWALVKLMYFGRVWYTGSVPITVLPDA
ncbi:MAG: glycoside hydrolase [Streptosporangiaceae bacterium]|nr:glycoside hydrolase [Streptosporangiaceae bacterium]